MNQTIKEILKDIDIESEDAILAISENLFINEPISGIKEKATAEAFTIFVGAQTIGCWKWDSLTVGIFWKFPGNGPLYCYCNGNFKLI
jgi:tRNA nucleotidyltransferase (CCA-adding enzyme)